MNKRCFSLYLDFGSLIVIMIQIADASVPPSHRHSSPVIQNKTKDKTSDLQLRSESTLLDEHLKLNHFLQKNLVSNEKLLNRQVNQNLQHPEIQLKKMQNLKPELLSGKQLSFNPEESSHRERDYESGLPFSHLLSPYLEDSDFELERPVLTPDLAQKYQRQLHDTLKSHQQSLHEALKNNHNNLHHALNKNQIQNTQKFNKNQYNIQSSLSSGPNEGSLFNNDHISYNHEDIKPQTDNSYASPPSNPVSSFDGQGHSYEAAHSPALNSHYEQQNHNHPQGHVNDYVKSEEPYQGVKTHSYPPKNYYYENEKVKEPVSHINQHNGYDIREKGEINGNTNLNSEYPINVYLDGKGHNVKKVIPNQYNLNSNSNSHSNKNSYDTVPHNYQNNKNQNVQSSYGSNDGNMNPNYQNGYNYAPDGGPVHNNKNKPQAYSPIPHSEHNNQNQHSNYANMNDGSNKYNKNGNRYSQNYGTEVNKPACYDGCNQNYNPNNRIKNNNPQINSANGANGYHNNQMNYGSPNPNSGYSKGQNFNNRDNSQGNRQVSNPNLNNQAQNHGQNYNKQINNNNRYNNGMSQHGYNRGPPVDDRKNYKQSPNHGKNNYDGRNRNGNYPLQQNMKNFNGKNYHNGAPIVSSNKSAYGRTSQRFPTSKSNNMHNFGYMDPNQKIDYPNYQTNFYNNGNVYNSGNNIKSLPKSSLNSNGSGYHSASYRYRKDNPLKVPAASPEPNPTKAINAPVIHHLFMSEPLIKDGMFPENFA